MAKWREYINGPDLMSKLIELKKVCFIINVAIKKLKAERRDVNEIKKLVAERCVWRKYHKDIERAYIYRYREYLQQEREYRRNKVLIEEVLSFCRRKKRKEGKL